MDSEELLQCPYDKNHQIRPKRFPYHIVKCRENNVKAARDKGTCPYNARHRPNKKELDGHILSCPDRWLSENFEAITVNPTMSQRASRGNWQSPPCQEDWENDNDAATSPFVLDQGGLSFVGDDLRKLIESEQSEQRKDFRSPQACATWDAGASGWEDDTPVVRQKTSKGACVTNRFHNDRRNMKLKSPAVTESIAKSNPWRSDLSPKRTQGNQQRLEDKDDMEHLLSPPCRQNTSENPMTGQSAAGMEQKPYAVTGQGSSPQRQKPNPWKTDMGHLHSPPHGPVTSDNPMTGQSAARMEQKPYAVTGQGSSPRRQKPNPWKADMGHLHSPPPVTGQSAAGMEQKPNAVTGQGSSPRRLTPNPWKTDAQSYPATHCDDNTEHFPLLSDHRPSRKEQKLQNQIPTWGPKFSFWKDGLEVVVSPPSPQFADDIRASGQGQNESRVLKEGPKMNRWGGRGGLTWGDSSGPSKTGPFQEKRD